MKYLNEKKLKRDPRIRSYSTPGGEKRYRVSFKKTLNGKAVPFEKQGFPSANDAIDWATEALNDALIKRGKPGHNITVQNYYNFWFKKNSDSGYWKQDTIVNYERIFNKWLLPRFGQYRLTDITRDEFQKYITEMQNIDRGHGKIGMATNTLRTIKRTLSALLNDAVASEQLDANRVKGIHIKEGIGERNLKISPEKYQEALQTAQRMLDPMPYAAFMLTTIGLRHGEVLGLKPKYVHQTYIEIRESRTAASPEGTTPKTKSSIRDVPITQTMYNILTQAIYAAKQSKLEHEKSFDDNSFIFLDQEADPLSFGTLNHYFRRIGDAIDFHIFPHMMRHAFATFAIPIAGSTQDVANILGHSDISMTEYYDTGTDGGATDIMQKLEQKYN